jgi:DNA-binding Xre family transcriptional regulator
MTKKIIPITCNGAELIDVNLFIPIQGNLKTRTREQLYGLRSSIIKYGFSFPVFVWKDGKDYFTLDGHGRDFVSKELVSEGWRFKQKDGIVNTSLPCCFIDAKNRIQAKEKLLALNSEYGNITKEGLISYILEPGFELKIENLKTSLIIPNINLEEVELNLSGSQIRFDKIVNEICEKLNLKVKEVFDYKIGKGDQFTRKFKGDKLENTIKANDLFFEIRK